MRRILVLGGAGYVGGALTDELIRAGYEPVVLDNLLYEDRYLRDVEFIRADVRDERALARACAGVDAVVHLAAIVGDEACACRPGLARQINTDSVRLLRRAYPGHIVFTSTCSVYGASDDVVHETSDLNPLSLYAETKIRAELALRESDRSATVLRLGTLFGIGDTHSRVRFDLVLNLMSRDAVSAGCITVFGGEQWRPLLHVRDAARAIVFALVNRIVGVYNVALDNYQIRQIAIAVSDLTGCRIETEARRFPDHRNYRVDCSRWYATGWTPKLDLKHGIRQIRDAVREGRIKNLDDPSYWNARAVRMSINN